MSSTHQIGLPKRVPLETRDGRPIAVRGIPVESVREEWLVEDGWWTERPVRRSCFELVLTDGRNVVVFQDLVGGGWHSQRD